MNANKQSPTILFFQRRYDDFLKQGTFEELFRRQYHWVSYLQEKGYRVVYIFGAELNKTIKTDIGDIWLVKDFQRSNPMIQSRKFYKDSAQIINQLNVKLIICHNILDAFGHFWLKQLTNKHIHWAIQDHGSRYKLKYKILSPLLKTFDHIFFNSPGQEEKWVANNVLNLEQVWFIPEAASDFSCMIEKRQLPSSSEKIAILWIGNLDINKDPITILKALAILLKDFPQLKLEMIFKVGNLRKEVDRFIEQHNLSTNVTLRGKVEHSQLLHYFTKSHYFILGSAKEGSGYSVIEAISCGVVPILSDIPSFRDLTDNESFGALFKRGDVDHLVEKTTKLLRLEYYQQSHEAKHYYDRKYSANAIANRLIQILEIYDN